MQLTGNGRDGGLLVTDLCTMLFPLAPSFTNLKRGGTLHRSQCPHPSHQIHHQTVGGIGRLLGYKESYAPRP
jgi:hypothetical protein